MQCLQMHRTFIMNAIQDTNTEKSRYWEVLLQKKLRNDNLIQEKNARDSICFYIKNIKGDRIITHKWLLTLAEQYKK